MFPELHMDVTNITELGNRKKWPKRFFHLEVSNANLIKPVARFLESSVKAKEVQKTVFESMVDTQLLLHVAFLLSSFAKRWELKIQSSQQCSSFSSHGVIILVSCQLLPCLKVAYINFRSSHLNDHLILSKRLIDERSLCAGIVHNIFSF